MYYTEIKQQIAQEAKRCGRKIDEITLLTVSKNVPIEAIQAVYEAGCRDFGENRLQEGLGKIQSLPTDIRWHLVGSLQKNKVNHAIEVFSLIHSVDSFELAQKISECSQRKGKETSILLQVNVSGERTKHGFKPSELREQLLQIDRLPNLRVEGLMTMAPLTEDEAIIRSCFRQLFELLAELQKRVKKPELFKHLSMGMSHDFLIAIQEGATILRVGTAIFN